MGATEGPPGGSIGEPAIGFAAFERKEAVGEARHEYVERPQELQETIAEEARRWAARIDDYDMDPAQTTPKAFEERVGLREIERQVNPDLATWKSEGQSHDVG